MSTPILRQGNKLIVTVQSALSDKELLEVRAQLAERVGSERIKGLVVDVSALDVLDSFSTRTLLGIARVSRLRGASTVIVGIQPDVAFAMVQLGLSLEGVSTALDLDEGLQLLEGDTTAGQAHAG